MSRLDNTEHNLDSWSLPDIRGSVLDVQKFYLKPLFPFSSTLRWVSMTRMSLYTFQGSYP